MLTIRPFAKSTPTLILALLISGCTALEPVLLPDENTPAAFDDTFWQSLEPELDEDWFVLLNRGTNALDWRLKTIDSATQSIEIQTFLWGMDTVGSLVIDNRVAIVGGRNLADEYFGLHTEVNFRGMEVLLGGSMVPTISHAFDGYWPAVGRLRRERSNAGGSLRPGPSGARGKNTF